MCHPFTFHELPMEVVCNLSSRYLCFSYLMCPSFLLFLPSFWIHKVFFFPLFNLLCFLFIYTLLSFLSRSRDYSVYPCLTATDRRNLSTFITSQHVRTLQTVHCICPSCLPLCSYIFLSSICATTHNRSALIVL